jgi:hypothetical protein
MDHFYENDRFGIASDGLPNGLFTFDSFLSTERIFYSFAGSVVNSIGCSQNFHTGHEILPSNFLRMPR